MLYTGRFILVESVKPNFSGNFYLLSLFVLIFLLLYSKSFLGLRCQKSNNKRSKPSDNITFNDSNYQKCYQISMTEEGADNFTSNWSRLFFKGIVEIPLATTKRKILSQKADQFLHIVEAGSSHITVPKYPQK